MLWYSKRLHPDALKALNKHETYQSKVPKSAQWIFQRKVNQDCFSIEICKFPYRFPQFSQLALLEKQQIQDYSISVYSWPKKTTHLLYDDLPQKLGMSKIAKLRPNSVSKNSQHL